MEDNFSKGHGINEHEMFNENSVAGENVSRNTLERMWKMELEGRKSCGVVEMILINCFRDFRLS